MIGGHKVLGVIPARGGYEYFEDDDNYNVLLGVARPVDRRKYEPVFRRIAMSFRRC